MALKLKKVNDEVYYSEQSVVSLSQEDLDSLIGIAETTLRKRVRICYHSSPLDTVHEMVIVHPKEAYVRPHKHLKKSESMIILRGSVDYVTFSETGKVTQLIPMGDINSGETFFQSTRSETFHTLIIHTEWLVFMEITKGPFLKKDTVFPEWTLEKPTDEEKKNFFLKIYEESKSI